ncbi:transposase [Metasolibacillus fluoroglycofenilyticus]|uniref:transposase n=1 Tax=Metasolibacillus fluoroglycofenilyticus TaxID=1239396 RepID=UPI000D3578B5
MKRLCPNKLLPFLAIDDFAFRKGDSYGTIICDLRTNQPIALLKGRDTSTVVNWLEKQPPIYAIARDGSNSYKTAITTTSPGRTGDYSI